MEGNTVDNEAPYITSEEMKTVMHEAWSIENKAAWPDAGQEDTFLFETQGKNGRISQFFKDENGNYWFRNVWRGPDGRVISEEEHIFGQSRQRKDRGNRKHRHY